jgi:hypothetical protein
VSLLKKPKPFVIQDALRRLDSALREFYGYDVTPGGELLDELASFEEKYQQFIIDQSPVDAFALLRLSDQLLTQIREHHRAASAAITLLRVDVKAVPSDQRFSVFLPSRMEVSDFLAKLEALRDIYERLAHALDISIDEYPFRVLRIEVGSAWIEAAGNPMVIALVCTVIAKALDFMTKRFAERRPVYKDEPELARLKDALGLASELKKLQEKGNVTSADEVAAIVSKRLMRLLENESRVELNGTTYVIAKEQVALPDSASPKQLSDKASGP